jgi:hypothetical protein
VGLIRRKGLTPVNNGNLVETPQRTYYQDRFMTTRRKFGSLSIIFSAAVLTSAGLFLLGLITISMAGRMGWGLGEYGPWLPLIGLEYGLLLGIIIGAIVSWKKFHST